jgi:hypothetical protein
MMKLDNARDDGNQGEPPVTVAAVEHEIHGRNASGAASARALRLYLSDNRMTKAFVGSVSLGAAARARSNRAMDAF